MTIENVGLVNDMKHQWNGFNYKFNVTKHAFDHTGNAINSYVKLKGSTNHAADSKIN